LLQQGIFSNAHNIDAGFRRGFFGAVGVYGSCSGLFEREPLSLYRRPDNVSHTPPARSLLLVNFDFDSDRLTKSATESLGEFAKALQDPRLKGERFEIDGDTDATGAEEYNQGLSERRASAVVSYLISLGLDASQFVAKGFGKTKPRVPDPYSPENRRVETRLVE
jgi:outer membrane protein OmpA-like peptidoglycan-associated protein